MDLEWICFHDSLMDVFMDVDVGFKLIFMDASGC